MKRVVCVKGLKCLSTYLFFIFAFMACLAGNAKVVQAEEFPLRLKYSSVVPITTGELSKNYSSYTIIDVRSRFEYHVIHIKKSISLPLSDEAFAPKLASIVDSKSSPIVFYCNGITCAKSYKAATKVSALGYSNVFAYDAGIFTWTETYPDRAVLLGESPVDTSKLISKEQFESRLLPVEVFSERAVGADSVIFDVREEMQKAKTPSFARNAVNMSMDKLVYWMSMSGFQENMKDKELYIFDAVGKQVRWLQYHLEKNGFENYYFLKKGAWSVFGQEGAIK